MTTQSGVTQDWLRKKPIDLEELRTMAVNHYLNLSLGWAQEGGSTFYKQKTAPGSSGAVFLRSEPDYRFG